MYFCENHILVFVQNPIFAGTYLGKKTNNCLRFLRFFGVKPSIFPG